MKALSTAQSEDTSLQQVVKYCTEAAEIDNKLKPFWFVRAEFSVHNNLLLHGSRLVIPESLQQEVLGQLHEGHQGIVKCRNRARISVAVRAIYSEMPYTLQKFSDCYRISDHYKITV